MMPVCEICGDNFKQLNNFHLKKQDLTEKEYKELYPNYDKFDRTKRIKSCKKIEFYEDENGCFICTSHRKRKNGYYNLGMHTKVVLMHRFIYEQCFGVIPDGLLVRHKCDNRYCINPEHLELGTHADNLQDMYERNRDNHPCGEEQGTSKLTERRVMEILDLLEEGKLTQKAISEMYNIGTTAIWEINKRKSWKKTIEKWEEMRK